MLTIIGCGNPTRGDDGLGPFVVRRLQPRVASLERRDVRAFDAGTDGMAVMFAARGTDELVIVDAARTGVEPGAVYEVPGDVLARDYAPSLNLHDFRWDHALAAGRRIYGASFPRAVTVVLVEAATTAYGLELSEPVGAAAERVIERVEAIVADYVARVPVVGATEACVSLRAGSIYFDAATFDRFLPERDAVTLVRRDDDLFIVPLVDSALGGYLCKRRTAVGDRVVHAEEFFRGHGLVDSSERVLAADWRVDVAAFVVPGVFGARA